MNEDLLSRPPKNIPYLISTLGDIKRQQTLVDVHKARWQATYPTWRASHEAKLEWLRKVENGNDGNCLHDVKDALKEILCETVGTPITVQLLVRGDNIGVARTIVGRKFHTSTIYYPQGEPPSPIMFIVAQECVDVGTRSDVLVPKLLAKAGFPIDALVRCAPPRAGVANDIKFNEEWPEFVGEGVHFPLNVARNHSAVAFEVMDVRHRLPPFERELNVIAHAHAKLMPAFVLVQKDGIMADTVPTSTTHDPIWYCERIEFERCRWHVRKGLGETDEVRRALDNGGDHAARLRLKMIQGEINYVRRIGGPARWRRKLATLLALTLEIRRDLDFVHKSGSPKEAAKVFTEIAEHWRTKLLMQRTNEELGLCFDQKTVMGTKSRAALFVLLKRIQNVVENTTVKGHNTKFYFNCLPKVPQQPPPALTVPAIPVTVPANQPAPQLMNVQSQTGTSTAQNFVVKQQTPMVIQKPTAGAVPSNGVNQVAAAHKPIGPAPNTLVKSNLPLITQIPRVITQKRLMPGSAKPSGRTPNDSKGLPMKWDSIVGIWRSTTNPAETKMTNVKVARSGIDGMATGNTNFRPVTQPAAVQPAAAVQQGGATPMDVDTGKTTEKEPANAQMSVDKTNMTAAATTSAIAAATATSAIAPSTAPPVAANPSPSALKPAVPQKMQNNATPIRTSVTPLKSPQPTVPASGATRNQVPSVSTPTNVAAKPVMSAVNTTPSSTVPAKPTPSSTAVNGTPKAVLPAPGTRIITTATPSAGTTLNTGSAPTATPTAAAAVAAAVAVATPATPATVTQIPKVDVNPNVGATTPSGVANGTIESRNNSARPAGRAPHDKGGHTMVWDGVNRVWRSMANPSETRTPNLRPIKPPGVPAAAGSPLTLPAAMTGAAVVPSGVASPRSSRPVGRAPNDSAGSPMVWDPNMGVWRSVKVANEVKRPKLKPPPHNAVFSALQKE